ncbi:MAG: hypothetical protein NTW07_01335 [candidate division Zixibacteria bacterium]|nr:hypothetical protein [candidate division Zixibacteria bacterium]
MFNKINPVALVYRLPFAKRHFEKMGIDPVIEVDKAFRGPEFGLSTLFADFVVMFSVFASSVGVLLLWIGFFQPKSWLTFYHFVGCGVLSAAFNYALVWRRDKYLGYFKKFEKMPPKVRRRWAWTSLAFVLGVILFLVGSFNFMDSRQRNLM